jgi:predicted amidophosphoribosyltransferase
MLQVLRGLGNADVRELVIQTESMEATHVSDQRHTINELVANYEIDEDQAEPEPTHIVIVDDMMTAGAHFRAMARVLGERFPAVPISGVFLARRIFPENNG